MERRFKHLCKMILKSIRAGRNEMKLSSREDMKLLADHPSMLLKWTGIDDYSISRNGEMIYWPSTICGERTEKMYMKDWENEFNFDLEY